MSGWPRRRKNAEKLQLLLHEREVQKKEVEQRTVTRSRKIRQTKQAKNPYMREFVSSMATKLDFFLSHAFFFLPSRK